MVVLHHLLVRPLCNLFRLVPINSIKHGESIKSSRHFLLDLLFILLISSPVFVSCQYETVELDIVGVVKEADDYLKYLEMIDPVNGTAQPRKRGGRFNKNTHSMDREMSLYEHSLQIIVNRTSLHPEMAHNYLFPFVKNQCAGPRVPCAASRYRTIDGSCNNLFQSSWGQANTAQSRLLRPEYQDGRSAPRGGLFVSSLPNPRLISTTLHFDLDREYPRITNLVAAFGQFLDHDITFTPEGDRRCCNGSTDPSCWPIQIPENDPFYGPFGQECLDFTRSTSCADSRGVRQQMNINTAFIDASQIYGSTDERATQLRTGEGGRLVVNNQYPSYVLPIVSQVITDADTQVQGDFVSGDDRTNETPGLSLMHNLFHREHNRLADLIRYKRPDWEDERIYQEARRIVIAEMQVIVYKEFLPLILGPRITREYGLELDIAGKYSVYDATLNPSILNDFTAAAYRFGHTLVNNFFKIINSKTQQPVGSYALKDQYFQSDTLLAEGGRGFDYVVTSMLQTQAQNYDPFFARGLTNYLFRQRGMNFGQDLVTRNIQRGRDHGIPGFNRYRRYCGLQPVDWFRPPENIPRENWRRLMRVYRRADDIDFYSGGLHEEPANGGIAGATFQCIIAIQFERLKYGDRYFFTHYNQEGSFTLPQIQALSQRRMSDIICNNGIQPFVQDNAFITPSEDNPNIYCSDESRDLDIDVFVG